MKHTKLITAMALLFSITMVACEGDYDDVSALLDDRFAHGETITAVTLDEQSGQFASVELTEDQVWALVSGGASVHLEKPRADQEAAHKTCRYRFIQHPNGDICLDLDGCGGCYELMQEE